MGVHCSVDEAVKIYISTNVQCANTLENICFEKIRHYYFYFFEHFLSFQTHAVIFFFFLGGGGAPPKKKKNNSMGLER